mmetsp:Transcript_125107/g.389459  ORF Transcript_125107/g.389459 Transcript_125107/m.389459 type:complete len:284 (-) Transcript_125107:796-1647(-)
MPNRPRTLSGFAFSSAFATSASMPARAPTTAATPTNNLSCENFSRGTPGCPAKASDLRMPSTFSWGRSKLHSPLTNAPTSRALSIPSLSRSYCLKRISCFSAAFKAACLLSSLSLAMSASRFRALTLDTMLSASRSAVLNLLRNAAASCRVVSVVPWSLRYLPDMKSAQALRAVRVATPTASKSSAVLTASSLDLPIWMSMESIITLQFSTFSSAPPSSRDSSPWSLKASSSAATLWASSRSCCSRASRAFSSCSSRSFSFCSSSCRFRSSSHGRQSAWGHCW